MDKKEQFEQLLLKLLDVAVTEGRDNWDSYYGYDNEYHLAGLDRTPEYEALVKFFEENSK